MSIDFCAGRDSRELWDRQKHRGMAVYVGLLLHVDTDEEEEYEEQEELEQELFYEHDYHYADALPPAKVSTFKVISTMALASEEIEPREDATNGR